MTGPRTGFCSERLNLPFFVRQRTAHILALRTPEPIDLGIDGDSQTLYWTDRGDPPTANSLKSIKTSAVSGLKKGSKNPKYNILTRQLHEAIGLKLG